MVYPSLDPVVIFESPLQMLAERRDATLHYFSFFKKIYLN